eukprot:CAMPEP_0172753758 /NCGR_PEP_ID=MMETSP1074-20121228/156615_1 /TAXON_ID=2916 /ORGANISM="Ceratium fusus, Strain PA161109" /LENGTH=258 /DNA_ID=CAMNT_0013586515 /DNA_START=163 /DNA_END=936 /DNA_ORIENTATION=+
MIKGGAVEIKTEKDFEWHRYWRWRVEKGKGRSRIIYIIRGEWIKVMWKTQKSNVVTYHYLWMNSGKPNNRNLRWILYKHMGKKKKGRKVDINTKSGEEFKEEDGHEWGRNWTMVVITRGKGTYEVQTTVSEWYKVSKPFLKALVPGTVVALKGGNKKKWCSDLGRKVSCNRPWIKAWEKFVVEDAGNGKIALRGGRRKKYCTVSRKKFKCSSKRLGKSEKFIVEELGNGQIALKDSKGKYCTDEGRRIKCNAKKVGAW